MLLVRYTPPSPSNSGTIENCFGKQEEGRTKGWGSNTPKIMFRPVDFVTCRAYFMFNLSKKYRILVDAIAVYLKHQFSFVTTTKKMTEDF